MLDAESRKGVVGRRGFLTGTGSFLLALAVAPGSARGGLAAPRRLRMFSAHTAERVDVEYFDGHHLLPDALTELDGFLRDFRTGDIHPMDTRLLDLAWSLARLSGLSNPTFEVISGYRSPATNAMLHARSPGVAVYSMHLEGKALDLRLPGLPTERLRDLAIEMRRGGVGFYAASDFVHIDTGRVRRW